MTPLAHPRPTFPQRPGFALLSVIIAIVIGTLLLAATTLQVTQLTRISHALTQHRQTIADAEYTLYTTLATLDRTILSAHPVGYTTYLATTLNTTQLGVTLTKTNPALIWIVITATTANGLFHTSHRIALSADISADSTQTVPNALPIRGYIDLY